MGASKVRVATRPRKGYCGALLRATKRTRSLKALPAPRVEKTERGGGAGSAKKKGSAHVRPEPTSCSAADRVNTSKRLSPGATAPPVTLVVPSKQALHLAFNRRNYKRSLSCAEELPTQPEKPIRNVAGRGDCTAFEVWDANPLSEHAQSHWGLEPTTRKLLVGNSRD